jgi:hypothetical protein
MELAKMVEGTKELVADRIRKYKESGRFTRAMEADHQDSKPKSKRKREGGTEQTRKR